MKGIEKKWKEKSKIKKYNELEFLELTEEDLKPLVLTEKELKEMEFELQKIDFELPKIDFDFKKIEEIEYPILTPLSQEEERKFMEEISKHMMTGEEEKTFGKLINESLEKSEKEMREILDKTPMVDFNFKE